MVCTDLNMYAPLAYCMIKQVTKVVESEGADKPV